MILIWAKGSKTWGISSILHSWSAEVNFLRFFLHLRALVRRIKLFQDWDVFSFEFTSNAFGSSWLLCFFIFKRLFIFSGEAQHPCNLGWIRSMIFGLKPALVSCQNCIIGNSVFGEFLSLVTSIWKDLHTNLESFQPEGCQGNFLVLYHPVLIFPSPEKSH